MILYCTVLFAGFSIEGPSQSRIECKDNEDGSAEISYFPLTPGEYAVHILVDNEDINNSPFMAAIQPTSSDFDPSKVSCLLFYWALECSVRDILRWNIVELEDLLQYHVSFIYSYIYI